MMASASSSVTHRGSGSKARSFAVRLVRSTEILFGGFRTARIPLALGMVGVSVPILLFAPDAGEGCLDLLLEAGDQFAVGGDQSLLGFDFGDDGLLRG